MDAQLLFGGMDVVFSTIVLVLLLWRLLKGEISRVHVFLLLNGGFLLLVGLIWLCRWGAHYLGMGWPVSNDTTKALMQMFRGAAIVASWIWLFFIFRLDGRPRAASGDAPPFTDAS